jgi:hypothetical protein
MKTVRSLTKEYAEQGLSTIAATHKAVDAMMAETQEALDSVYRQVAPKPDKGDRDISTTFRK